MGILMVQVGNSGIAAGAQFWSLAQEELHSRQHQASSLSSLEKTRAREQVWGMDSLFLLQETPGNAPNQHQHQLQSRALSVLMVDGSRTALENSRGADGLLSTWFEGYRWAAKQQIEDESLEPSPLMMALKSIQNQVEQDAEPADFILVFSWADAPSAGLGCHILEWLRRQYPFNCILVAAVLPDVSAMEPGPASGFYSVNTVLSAQWAQSYADGVLWFTAAGAAQQIHETSDGPRMASVEEGVGNGLAGLLLPQEDLATMLGRWGGKGKGKKAGPGIGSSVMGKGVDDGHSFPRNSICRFIVRTLCPDPAMKFLQVFLGSPSKIPGGGDPGWRMAAAHSATFLATVRIGNSKNSNPSVSTATLVFMRGPAGDEFPRDAEDTVRKMCDTKIRYAGWTRNPIHIINASTRSLTASKASSRHPFAQKAVMMVTNASSIAAFLSTVVQIAQEFLPFAGLSDSNLSPDEKYAAMEAAKYCANVMKAYTACCARGG